MYKFVIVKQFEGGAPQIIATGSYLQMVQRLADFQCKYNIGNNTIDTSTKTNLTVQFHKNRHMDPDFVKFWVRRVPG
jgi:hypothetical protein